MSTRSSARNLFPPLDNPELTIRRRSRANPTLLNEFEMAAEGNADPPVFDLRTMEELCQPSLNGRGGPIAPIAIQATNFGLKNDMIQQVQNSCKFHGLSGDDANKHFDKFLHVTQSIKVNGVTDDALRLYLFPHSLTHHATAWFDRLPRNSINTFEQMAKMFLGKYVSRSFTGSENRPPMLNKENYVPWSSRLLRYAKSRPNGKLIYNSIINGLYVRRMIPEPGSDIGIQEKKAKLFNEWERFTSANRESTESYYHRFLKLMNDLKRNKHFLEKIASDLKQIAQPGMNMGQDRQMQMVGGNGGNQFREYAGQNVGNLNGYNDAQNVRNQNLNGNGNLVAARVEGNATGHNGNQIRCYNYKGVGHFVRNCIVRPRRRDAAYLQTQLLIAQKEEAGIQLQAEEFDLMAAAADLDEIEEYTELLEPIPKPHQVPHNDNNVISEVSSVEQSGRTVEQHPENVKETCVLYDSL
nr:reverse transcriptase domain-containing protein [Tanacetum cinerariifolium]